MKTQIKFVVDAVKWFDKVNGNTYHSVRITRTRDGKILVHPWTYGYGDHYRQTAIATMAENKWLPVKYRKPGDRWSYERENGYPILWNVRDGLKREMVANGEL